MRMLIVEDEKDLCNILKKRLQKDYTIDVCMDGEIAKDYLNTYTCLLYTSPSPRD